MTDKNTDYSNLKEKTIFDFCKDAEMRKAIIGGDFTENEYKRRCHEINRYIDLFQYGIETNNNALCEAAMKAKKKAENKFAKMAKEAMRKGWIID